MRSLFCFDWGFFRSLDIVADKLFKGICSQWSDPNCTGSEGSNILLFFCKCLNSNSIGTESRWDYYTFTIAFEIHSHWMRSTVNRQKHNLKHKNGPQLAKCAYYRFSRPEHRLVCRSSPFLPTQKRLTHHGTTEWPRNGRSFPQMACFTGPVQAGKQNKTQQPRHQLGASMMAPRTWQEALVLAGSLPQILPTAVVSFVYHTFLCIPVLQHTGQMVCHRTHSQDGNGIWNPIPKDNKQTELWIRGSVALPFEPSAKKGSQKWSCHACWQL